MGRRGQSLRPPGAAQGLLAYRVLGIKEQGFVGFRQTNGRPEASSNVAMPFQPKLLKSCKPKTPGALKPKLGRSLAHLAPIPNQTKPQSAPPKNLRSPQPPSGLHQGLSIRMLNTLTVFSRAGPSKNLEKWRKPICNIKNQERP